MTDARLEAGPTFLPDKAISYQNPYVAKVQAVAPRFQGVPKHAKSIPQAGVKRLPRLHKTGEAAMQTQPKPPNKDSHSSPCLKDRGLLGGMVNVKVGFCLYPEGTPSLPLRTLVDRSQALQELTKKIKSELLKWKR